MLDLLLQPRQGNACGKVYPHQGFLGVTPVTVDGTIVLKPIDPAHLLSVKAISVVIKCRETRSFGGKEERTLWEKSKTVWKPAEGMQHQEIGFWSKPFSLSVPPEAIDQGAKSTQKTKEWKTVWRLDLVVEHKPITYVGHSITKSYSVNLYNHTTPFVPPPSPPQALSIGQDAHSAQVFINAPHGAFGPGDQFTLSFYAKPDDPNTTIKKAAVVLERRIETRDYSPRASSNELPVPSSSEKGMLFRRNISPRPLYHRISSNSSDSVEKAIINKITETSTDEVTPGSGGTHWCTMNLALMKRGGHWDIAETCATDITNVSFDLRVKIWIKSGRTTREFACPPMPICLAGVSMAERVKAQNAAADLADAAAVKAAEAAAAAAHVTPHKRKHRSSRRGLYMHEGTLDISQDLLGTAGSRRKAKSKADRTASSPILPITGVVTDIRPILRPSDHANTADPLPTSPVRSTNATVAGPSISFMFPSVLGGHPETPVLPPIQSLLDPAPPPTYSESYSILKQFQQTGRRVSTTTSEEEEQQPSRSRLRLDEAADHDHDAPAPDPAVRRGLPSLDALGLGLPFVPDDERPRSRPRTAPMFSTFSRNVPPPLSGQLSSDAADRQQQQQEFRPMSMAMSQTSHGRNASADTFAFGLPTVPGPPLAQSPHP